MGGGSTIQQSLMGGGSEYNRALWEGVNNTKGPMGGGQQYNRAQWEGDQNITEPYERGIRI